MNEVDEILEGGFAELRAFTPEEIEEIKRATDRYLKRIECRDSISLNDLQGTVNI